MNTIRLCGGLGNQLFQYAFGRMQRENGIDVYFDDSWYHKIYNAERLYLLDKFHTEVKFKKIMNARNIIREQGFQKHFLKEDGYDFWGYWQNP